MSSGGKNRTTSLRLVMSMAERAESDAARRLHEQRQQLQSQADQLQQITEYNQEYSVQIGQLGSVNVQQMVGQRNFLSQLSHMIQSQSETVDILRQQTAKAERLWHEKYHRRKKLAELIERLEREQNRLEQARLQKELDEISSGLFNRGATVH